MGILNVQGNIIGSGSSLTNLNYNAILNPPTLINFNNSSTFQSSLYVSETTTLNNATTCMSSLNVSGNIIGSVTALTNLNYNAITNKPDLSVYATNTILNSYSTSSMLAINNLNNKTNFTNLLVSGASTCSSSLNVSGITTFNNSLTNFWYNTPGTYFTNNGFDSYFSLNSNVITNLGTAVEPFITVYNRMWKNGANTAMDIKTFGTANSGVNSNVLIRIDSGGDPTAGTNAGTITYNINGSDKHIMTGSSFGINTITPGSYALNVNGNSNITGTLTTSGAIYANGDSLNFTGALNQYKINLWGVNSYGFGIAGSTLMYSSQGVHNFYNSTTNANTFSIDAYGNVNATGTLSTGNTATIKGTSEAGNSTLYLATPFTSGSAYKCALIAQGMSSYSRSKLHFCLNNVADNSYTQNASISSSRMTIDYNGNVGINNTSPWVDLNLGNVDVGGTSGTIVFGKNNGSGGIRNFRMGMSSNFFFCIGDCGNVNNNTAPWTLQSAISYQAPSGSFTISSTGTVIMPYSWNSSDERIKTNIKTIENALDKTLLLRGFEYNDFRYEPDKKHIGLIAQEVELVIPEAVGVNEFDNIKCISYNSFVGLLIEAVKELNNKVLKL